MLSNLFVEPQRASSRTVGLLPQQLSASDISITSAAFLRAVQRLISPYVSIIFCISCHRIVSEQKPTGLSRRYFEAISHSCTRIGCNVLLSLYYFSSLINSVDRKIGGKFRSRRRFRPKDKLVVVIELNAIVSRLSRNYGVKASGSCIGITSCKILLFR